MPLVMPVTTPAELIEPTAGELLLQVPPGITCDSELVAPTQTVLVPGMAGTATTDITNVL